MGIDFIRMIQHWAEDEYHQRPIKRDAKRARDDDDDDAPAPTAGKKAKMKAELSGVVFSRAGFFNDNTKIGTAITNHDGTSGAFTKKDCNILIVSEGDDTAAAKLDKARDWAIKVMYLPADFPATKNPDKEFMDAYKKAKIPK
eukprot:NODE_2169_length_502_cov_447.233996_g1772_i0.p1 GENE.NODE_2169_length_502_cov_447.233996_g1772_i0~~NODE_2169_length_502_cov_447.233996_g1772_i0.p1  ORF type:complete len:143 (-),score=26.46 NODE_2169_length_502_cov_447.233996_g1772_i0:42-470(-)